MKGRTDPNRARQAGIEQIASWWHAVRLHVPFSCTPGVIPYYLTCWHVAAEVDAAMTWAIAIRDAEHILCDHEERGRCREAAAEIKVDECRRRQGQVPLQCIRQVHGFTWIGGYMEELSTGCKRCLLARKLGPEERRVLPRRPHCPRLSSTRWRRCSTGLSGPPTAAAPRAAKNAWICAALPPHPEAGPTAYWHPRP